jgi:hypothetical protein
MNEDQLPFEPPETRYISANYVLKVPITDPHFDSPWKLRVYASKLINQRIGDEVQLTSMKVKKPTLTNKSLAKIFNRTPNARLYVTTKF